MNQKILTPTIRLLALVSLLAGMAGEMLYPVMPVYLRSVGFSVVLIGVLEGVAEAVAGLSKGYFGRLSDQSGRRLPFVQLGYLLSALSKPMMAVWPLPGWVFAARTFDRLGKGLRTAPRDALLAAQSVSQTRGQVFGFHRSMDTLGAVIGPVAALVYLYYFPGQYVTLFLLAFGPALVSIGLTFWLTEPVPQTDPLPAPAARQPVSVFGFLHYWRVSSPDYRRVVGGLLVFALFNSSDVFLLLRIKEAGLSDTAVVGLYIFYNAIHALMAYPIGRLADRLGLKPTLLMGLGLFALVYEGMAIADHVTLFIGLMALYGLYAAATEGLIKAWISTVSGPGDTATAIGTYAGLSSVCALIANSLAGWLWYAFGAALTFWVTGAATLLVIVYLVAIEGRHEKVGNGPMSRTRAIINLYNPLMDVRTQPPAQAPSDQRSVVTMTRSAFIALLVLLASLGGWIVYVSFGMMSTTTRAQSPATRPTRAAGVDSTRLAGAQSGGRTTADQPADKPQPKRGPDPVPRPKSGPTLVERTAPAPVVTPAAPEPVADRIAEVPVTRRDTAASTVSTSTAGTAATIPAEPAAGDIVRPTATNRYTLSSTYAYFHNEPDERTRRAAFINIWNRARLTPLADRNGFIYVVYTNEQGQTSRGWLLKRNLKRLGK